MINIDLEQVPINVTEHIKRFRLFLISCWPHIDNLMEFHDWDEDGRLLDDWLDLNWHLFVEREILEGKGKLTPLSVPLGEDFMDSTENKFSVEACLTDHDIKNLVKMDDILSSRMRLFGFSSKLDIGFGLYPPFDTASLVIDSTKQILRVPFEYLDFYLVKYPIQQN